MLVSATLAWAMLPFSRLTAAATPDDRQDWGVRWNF
jgi:hypothetical protein